MQHRVYVPVADRELRITRAEFEDLVVQLRASVDELRATIRRAGLEPADLAAVYLVGGSSPIPMVTRLVADRTGVVPTTYDDPKSVVVSARPACCTAQMELHPAITAPPTGGSGATPWTNN